MPTRSKPNARARALMSAASVLLVDAEDFIGLLFHAHRGGVDAIRDGLIKRLTLVQQSLEPRKPISVGSQQGAMGRVFHALVGDAGIHPATDHDAGTAKVAEVVRIAHHAA